MGGAVMIYKRSPGRYHQLGNIIYANTTGENIMFGNSMLLSKDGNRIAVFASTEDVDNPPDSINDGSARVFEFDASQNIWIQLGNTIRGIGLTDQSGNQTGQAQVRAGINANGSIIAVGEREAPSELGGPGIVRIFEYNGSDWVQKGNTIEGEASLDSGFGQQVNMSDDGLRIRVGAYRYTIDDGTGTDIQVGKIYTYEYDSGSNVWNLYGQPITGDIEDLGLGGSETNGFSSDGYTLSHGVDTNASGVNYSARVYKYNGSEWEISHEIPYYGLTGGTVTRLSGDGKYLLVFYYDSADGIVKTFKLLDYSQFILHQTDTITLQNYIDEPHKFSEFSSDGSTILITYRDETRTNMVNGQEQTGKGMAIIYVAGYKHEPEPEPEPEPEQETEPEPDQEQ